MQEIIPTKYYSARKLVSMKVLPWSSTMTFYKKLKEPRWIAIFNPLVEEKKTRTYNYIKGENIINFLTMAKNGQINQNEN